MTELPTTFGKYYLTEKLATGGMAEIYLAKLIGPGGFEKQLVIKQIHPKLSHQRHFVDLFVAEAKTLVTLAHGNIVPVYELGVIDDMYFIAMDYIDGPTLYRLTETMARRDEKMEPAVAAWIVARILEGLDYAHRKGEGVIHRDLSPRNVMLSRDGEVKLVDFGIAVTLGEPNAGAEESAPTGSFPYMSPEQVRREPLTGQTDLFSAGVLLWEMLVGERLFARPGPEETLAAVLGATIPRPSERRPEVPAKLDEVVMRALERDRDARWANAGEMLGALNRYLYSLDATPGPRDVEALVARFCPPETRRMPTHVEAELGAEQPKGPATAVIPRDAAAAPAGKKKVRAQTFATHVAMQEMLERAKSEEESSVFGLRSSASVETEDRGPKTVDRRPKTVDRSPLLTLAALGAIALGGGAIFVFFHGRAAVLAEDARAIDARPVDAAIDAAVDAPADAEADAPAVPRDADVAVHAPRDATIAIVHPRGDSALGAIDAGATATATLALGADPWGEIYIDDKPYGHTPQRLTVSAGHHTVKIVFPAETPPRTQTFAVDVAAGETKALEANFR